METQTFNCSTRKEELWESEVNPVYKTSSRELHRETLFGRTVGEGEGGFNNQTNQKPQNYVAYSQFLKLKAELT